jgi:hypothetical protein
MPLLISPPAFEEAPNTHVTREPSTAASSVISGPNVQQPLPEVISSQSQQTSPPVPVSVAGSSGSDIHIERVNRSEHAVQYGELDADPVEVPQLLSSPSTDDTEIINEHIDNMLHAAGQNGLPAAQLLTLRALVYEFIDIWRVSLSDGPPSALPPLIIKLRPDAVPVRVKLRRYPPAQREFLKHFVDELVRSGLAYRNPRATWCSAALLVPKPGPAMFRFTVDLRPVNKQTVPCSWPMPHIKSELARVHGSQFFATLTSVMVTGNCCLTPVPKSASISSHPTASSHPHGCCTEHPTP